MALENASIEERTIDTTFRVQFEYPLLNKVMRLIRDLEVNILHQEMTLDCRFDLSIRQKESQKVIQTFKEVYGLAVTTEEDL